MTTLPQPTGLKNERERLFSLVYDRALTTQEHIVDTHFLQSQGIRYGLRTHLDAWQKDGLGRVLEQQDGRGNRSIHFSLNDAGVQYAQQLIEQAKRESLKTRVARNLWPAVNALGSLVAAMAAIVAAYYAYIGAQR